MSPAHGVKDWARRLKRDVVALWLAALDPRTLPLAKIIAAAVAAYALSPIDLIPDAIPVVGLIDDLLIVPLGILLAIRLIPPDLMTEFRTRADQHARPVSRAGAIVIIALWIAALAATGWAIARWLSIGA
ncbi:MAG: DUF1232 domain-containing protein [Rhodobacteraceae bacterium]|nr:DUF1232 domain-containing protein [Paracoccaceae bacterium]